MVVERLSLLYPVQEAKAIAASQVSMLPYIIAAGIYWGFTIVVEFILNRIEKKLDYYHD